MIPPDLLKDALFPMLHRMSQDGLRKDGRFRALPFERKLIALALESGALLHVRHLACIYLEPANLDLPGEASNQHVPFLTKADFVSFRLGEKYSAGYLELLKGPFVAPGSKDYSRVGLVGFELWALGRYDPHSIAAALAENHAGEIHCRLCCRNRYFTLDHFDGQLHRDRMMGAFSEAWADGHRPITPVELVCCLSRAISVQCGQDQSKLDAGRELLMCGVRRNGITPTWIDFVCKQFGLLGLYDYVASDELRRPRR